MNPPATKFNANMLSSRQKRQLQSKGSFRNSRGGYQDASGRSVSVPNNTNINTTDNNITNAKVNAGQLPQNQTENVPQANASGMTTPQINNALTAPITSPVPANNIAPGTPPTLPEPVAGDVQEEYMTGVAGDVTKYRNIIDTTLTSEKERIDTEIEQLKKEEADILANQQELSQPFREDLENKERERLYINKNFEDNQKLVEELDSLLTEGNELIRISKGRAVANTVLNQSVNKTLSDVQARAGVIQAVMSARNNQIAQAENMIDRSVAAITADRQDSLSYYDTLLNLNNQGLLKLDKESKDIATEQRNLAYNDLNRAQETADFVKKLMISPETAKFMADAGITLTDSVDVIKEKMGKETTRVELINESKAAANVAISSGYAQPEELSILNDMTVDTATKKALAEKIVARSAKSEADMKIASHNAQMESVRLGNRAKTIEMALSGDPDALEALNYDPRVANSEADLQAHAAKTLENTSLLDAVGRISKNNAGLKSSTGAVTNSWLQGLFAGPMAGSGAQDRGALSKLVSLTPVIGNVSNAVYAVNAKKDFVGDLNYLVQNDTFKKYAELKASGISLTPFTDADARRITAAGVLGALVKFDPQTNEVIGINGSEKAFKRALEEFQLSLLDDQDTSNSDFVTDDEKTFIRNAE